MTDMLMTDQAATTTEGSAASQAPGNNASTDAAQSGNQQQASQNQNQQAPDGAKAGDTQDQGKPQGAPESYEFTAPEGAEYDKEIIGEFSDVAKELNLTQDAAKKLVDRLAPKMHERQMERINAVRNEWAQTAMADKEFGGEKLSENLAVAKKALDTFGSPELRSLLNESGLGNHPEVIRMMYRAGMAISEDRYVGGSNGGGKSQPKDFGGFANALYSNQQS